jgi:hypothetical protein
MEFLAQASETSRPLWVDLTAYSAITGLLVFVITRMIPAMQERCHAEQAKQWAEHIRVTLEIQKAHDEQLTQLQASHREVLGEFREQLRQIAAESQQIVLDSQKRSEEFTAGIFDRSTEERQREREHQKELAALQAETARLMQAGAQTLQRTIEQK